MSSLSTFDYEDTDLCVPDDESFKTWLESIQDHRGSGMECPPPDRDILVAFYEATHGSEWVNSHSWLTDVPLAEWHGVSTDDSGRVDSLSLSRNGLTGPIPTGLGGLSNLVALDLEASDLTDSIPTELGNLTNLQALILRTNRLTGHIPPGLGQLSRLENLNLCDNTLTGRIPPELGQLSELEFLWLSYNELTGPIPPELGQLSELQLLWLSHNDSTATCPRNSAVWPTSPGFSSATTPLTAPCRCH